MPTVTLDTTVSAWIVTPFNWIDPKQDVYVADFGSFYDGTSPIGDAEFDLQGSSSNGNVEIRVIGSGPSLADWQSGAEKPFGVDLIQGNNVTSGNLNITLYGEPIHVLKWLFRDGFKRAITACCAPFRKKKIPDCDLESLEHG